MTLNWYYRLPRTSYQTATAIFWHLLITQSSHAYFSSFFFSLIPEAINKFSFSSLFCYHQSLHVPLAGLLIANRACYLIIDIPTLEWNDAQRNCQKLGGDLVKITSAAENQFLYNLILKFEANEKYSIWRLVGTSPTVGQTRSSTGETAARWLAMYTA